MTPHAAQWNRQDELREALDERDPPCILLADDDATMRQDLAELLREDGYEVVEMKNGIDVVEYLDGCAINGGRHRTPDIIVSDIRMPGYTGLEVLEGLREMYWSIPMILMTAFGSDETREEASRLGATAFFSKPFDVDDLKTAIVWSAPVQQ